MEVKARKSRLHVPQLLYLTNVYVLLDKTYDRMGSQSIY